MKNLTFALPLILVAGCAAPAFLQPAYQQSRNGAGSMGAGNQPYPGAYGAQTGYPQQATGNPSRTNGASPNGLDLGRAYRSETTVDENGQLTLGGDVPLRGWNGDVVQAPPGGMRVADEGEPRSLEPSPSGRMYIIELYQDLLDERDSLRQEVESLNESLLMAQGRIGSTNSSALEIQQNLRALEEELRMVKEENADLVARLTTAQIRRLEAEKMLLEAQVRWHRQATASDAGGMGAGKE